MMNFEGTALGDVSGDTLFEPGGITELSDEHLMLIHGGNSGSYVSADANPVVNFIVEIGKAVLVGVIADGVKDGMKSPAPPAQPTQQGNPSNGAEGRGSI